MADKGVYDLAVEAMHEKGISDATKLASRAVSGEATGTELIDNENQIPTWRQRDYTSVPTGTPYRYEGQVYKLWKQHDATEQPNWNPVEAVSLWDICHTTNAVKAKPYVTPQGTRGMYQPNDVCTLNGKVYRCVTPNTVYSPSEYPAAWEEVAG